MVGLVLCGSGTRSVNSNFLSTSGSPGRECYIFLRRQLHLRSGSICGVGMGYLVPWLDRIASLQINDFCA